MADVRGASGAPIEAAFGGQSAATPSTPLYVDLDTGDLYVLINNVVTLVGAIPGGSSYALADQIFGSHFDRPDNVQDSNQLLAMRSFIPSTPAAILGNASDLLSQRVFRTIQLPSWGA